MGRGVMIVLAASLGLNFFIAGFLLHDALDGDRPPPPRGSELRGFDNPRALFGIAEALPPDRRRQFRAAFREHLPNMREHHREMRTLRRELRILIEAEEWDGAVVAAKMTEIRSVRARQQQAFDEAFAAAISALPREDRLRMIEFAEQRRLEQRRSRKDGGRRD